MKHPAIQLDNGNLLFLNDLTHCNIISIIDFINNFTNSSITNIGYWQIVSSLISITKMLGNKPLIPYQSCEWIKMSCPYTFETISDTFNDNKIIKLVLPLNRAFGPLGIHPECFYHTYDKFEFQYIPANLINLKNCPKIINANDHNLKNRYFLYTDMTSPWFDRSRLHNYQINLFKFLNFNIIEKDV